MSTRVPDAEASTETMKRMISYLATEEFRTKETRRMSQTEARDKIRFLTGTTSDVASTNVQRSHIRSTCNGTEKPKHSKRSNRKKGLTWSRFDAEWSDRMSERRTSASDASRNDPPDRKPEDQHNAVNDKKNIVTVDKDETSARLSRPTEASRSKFVACLSAWPASRHGRDTTINQDIHEATL